MTWIHAVRGVYFAVSVLVGLTAAWRSWSTEPWSDRAAGLTLTAYALATAAAQAYAFNRPLTVGTLFIGVGVAAGAIWLLTVFLDGRG